jgi:hypothetical protein
MQRARSLAEARLFIDRQPCARCQRRGFAEPSLIVERGEDLAVACRGYCPGCGAERSFEILLADARVSPGAWGGDDPSTLLDAGQWLVIAEERATAVPAAVAALADPERARAAADLRVAIGAIAEVLKFIPAGDDRVPKTALFSTEGRELYLADPGRFSRLRIDAVLAAWRALAAQVE